MASAPYWKVYNAQGEYIAACKHVEDAAMLVSGNGDGATIRAGHTLVVWREGQESQPAGESYDFVHETCTARASAAPRVRVPPTA